MSLRDSRRARRAPAAEAGTDDRRRRARIETPAIACSLGEIRELSARGVRIGTGVNPGCAIGQRATITITGPSGPFVATIRPVWIRRTGLFCGEIGACFEDVNETTLRQILELVRRIGSEASEPLRLPEA